MDVQRAVALSAPILIQRQDAVVVVTLNRPAKRNAVNSEMYALLAESLEAASADPSIGALLIGANGPDFCTGNDMAEFALGSDVPIAERPVGRFLRALVGFEKPLLAAVHGRAIGFGVTLLLHCDVVLVARGARLRAPFTQLELCPEAAASVLGPARLGYRRSFDLFARNREIDAQQAVDWGLASELTETDALKGAAEAAAAELTAHSAASLSAVKRLMRHGLDLTCAIERELAELERLRPARDQRRPHGAAGRIEQGRQG